MPNGYWIVRIDISNPEAYKAYVEANDAPIAAFGGRFVVRGGHSEVPEGTARTRNVVLEFPSFAAARDCYWSEGYQAALKLRLAASTADFLIIEGYDGPQPTEGAPPR